MSRRTLMDDAPLGTMAVTIANVVVFALTVLSNGSLVLANCYSPRVVLEAPLWNAYRIVTSVFTHGSFPHVLLNLLAFVPMASSLERSIGTVQFTHLFAVIVFCMAAVHAALAMVLEVLVGGPVFCAIGMSGVVFALIVCETNVNNVGGRSIFGLFEVSSAWYPIVLLCFIQLVMPGVSFIGHSAGLITGYAYVKGFLNWALLRDTHVSALEEWPRFAYVRAQTTFVSGVGHSAQPNATTSAFPNFRNIPLIVSSSGAFRGEGRTLGGNGSTTGGLGVFAVDERKLATLIEMGFDSTEAKYALQQSEGDTSQAAQFLTEEAARKNAGEENV